MADIFNFLKETTVYIVHEGSQYSIDVGSINFSQTFTSNSYSTKTLHTQNMFEQTVINTANPANFGFRVNALRNQDYLPLFNILLDVSTFDLYVKTKAQVYKIEYSVITNGIFEVSRDTIQSITFQGEASKLLLVGESDSFTIPGTPIARTTPIYVRNLYNKVLVSGEDISSLISSISAELQNDISWVPHRTVQQSVNIEEHNGTMFPSEFTLNKRIFAGSISQYVTTLNSLNLQKWDSNTTLLIQSGERYGLSFYGFDFNIQGCSFTNRVTSSEVYTQSYDWQMTQNPSSIGDVIKYPTDGAPSNLIGNFAPQI